MARKRRTKAENFVPTANQALVARRMANLYLKRVKFRVLEAKPWRLDLPIEDLTAIWPHFLKAAALAEELKATPDDFIQAQFEEYFPRDRYPWPSQLHSDGARMRYTEWVYSKPDYVREAENSSTRKRNGEGFKLEEKRLIRLAKGRHTSLMRTLKDNCLLFPKDFLEHKGVWPVLKNKWLEAQSN